MQPLVSICCITYNHVNYIEEAIESFLMQKTTFPFEIIINDDASTDGTTEILQRFESKYPDIIFPIYHNKNEYSQGVRGIMARNTFSRARGKYIAICEGDDYWTDPVKLQKQVDFLEKNNEYSMVCHDALKINEITNTSSLFFGPAKRKQICSTKDTLNIHFCPTASIVFRKQAIMPLSNFDLISGGDQVIVQLISLNGLLYRMYDVMSVYRKTATGTSEAMRENLQQTLKERIESLKIFNEISHGKYQKYIRMEILLIQNRINLLRSKSKIKTWLLKINRRALSTLKRTIQELRFKRVERNGKRIRRIF